MAKIVVYDSGVGGLTILEKIAQLEEAHELVFVSDNAYFPYGTKGESQLLERVVAVSKAIENVLQPDILVIACNTASTIALKEVRSHMSARVVGVVPAIKPAAANSKSKVIGLLATPATIERQYTKQLINEFASGCRVCCVGSSTLVELAEEKLKGCAIDLDVLRSVLSPFFEIDDLDTLVLACTHFPLLEPEIKHLVTEQGKQIDILDSGAAIARRVQALLVAERSASRPAAAQAYLTKLPIGEDRKKLSQALRRYNINEFHLLELARSAG